MPAKKLKTVFIFIAASAFFWVLYSSGTDHQEKLKVVFFDVGQGDSIFIETPEKTQILVDGGPGTKVLGKLAENMPFWDRSLDFVILTHPEKDHFWGLMEVLKNYRVKNIVMGRCQPQTDDWSVWQRLVEDEKAKVFWAEEMPLISLGFASGRYLETIHPFDLDCPGPGEGFNEESLVLRLVWGDRSFLLAGDIGSKTEKKIIGKNSLFKSDVLKVAHHGSKYSTSEDFLLSVSPAVAVISCGRNNFYGHPHFSVLELLNKYDITVLRTDRQGDVILLTDGDKIFLKSQ